MRNATLDAARLVAAYGIVHFHADAPLAALGHAGLPFFLALAVVHAWQVRADGMGGAGGVAARARRLLWPWALWSAAYALAHAGQCIARDLPAGCFLRPWMLLTGPSLHLWFLPFALALTLAVAALSRVSAQLSARARLAVAAAAALAAVAAAGLIPPGPPVPPLTQWAEAVPPVVLAVAVMLAGQAALPLGLFALAAGLAGWPGNALPALAAVAALVLCRALPVAGGAGSRIAADLSLTIYLAHPAVAALVLRAWPALDRTATAAALTFALTLALTLALTALAALARRAIRSRAAGRAA